MIVLHLLLIVKSAEGVLTWARVEVLHKIA